jgi:hypothetical protein
MPRPYTCPTLLDECKTVSISFLSKHGYLNQNQWQTGTITWSRGEGHYKQITGQIDIQVNTRINNPYLQLNYRSNDNLKNYKVALISLPSNIGKGIVWYFVCPYTGKRCRKLYLVNGYFLHRTAFATTMYEKQTYSKSGRDEYRAFQRLFDRENAYEKIYSKYFKKFYAGKPTKRYARICKKTYEASQIQL